MKTNHKIIFGDARKMGRLSDESIHLVVTSPPYWQLKDYGSADQIGFDNTYEEYINNLNLVWQECYRVLKNGCRLCINIGDQFARSVYYGRYKIIPIRTEITRFCETIGFDFMGSIIWQKVTTCNTSGGGAVMGSYPYPRNGIIKIDYEFILLFKKQGTPEKVSPKIKELSKLTHEEWNSYFSGHWNFPGEKQSDHLAMFPEELPRRLIKMFSFAGETVLDPFLGSGTTALAAINTDRNSVGYEINKDFKAVINKRLSLSNQLFHKSDIQWEKEQTKISNNELSQLPYLFKDPVRLNKQMDPRKLLFGSKVSKDDSKSRSYFTVKDILEVDTFKLNTGEIIRLSGIKPLIENRGMAFEFLKKVVQGKQVFLKYPSTNGEPVHEQEKVFLYLKNKTFINAHLVKHGYAETDGSIQFKYRS